MSKIAVLNASVTTVESFLCCLEVASTVNDGALYSCNSFQCLPPWLSTNESIKIGYTDCPIPSLPRVLAENRLWDPIAKPEDFFCSYKP